MAQPTSRLTTITTRIARGLLAVALLATTLGACMSDPGTGKDDPLPVKDKKDAEAWARQMTEHMAQTAGIKIDPASIKPLFSGCTGRNGESAPDDRYILMYSVKSNVPKAQHPEVVRKIRDMLKTEGLTITTYQETVDGKVDGETDAYVNGDHPTAYSLTASTSGNGDRMYLRVTSPCLMPPATPSPSS